MDQVWLFMFFPLRIRPESKALDEETKEFFPRKGRAYTLYTGATPHSKVAGTELIAFAYVCPSTIALIFVKARRVDLPRNLEHDTMRQNAEVYPETCA